MFASPTDRSVTTSVLAVIGGAIAVLAIAEIALQSSANWRDIRAEAEKRASAGLTILELLHAESMLNRRQTADGDPAIATLDGAMARFSTANEGMRLWLVMGPKVLAHQQRTSQRDLEPPLDDIDELAIASAQTQTAIKDGWLRTTRPIVLGRGLASNDKCASCHADLMGVKQGEVIGAASAAVDLGPATAAWRHGIWRDAALAAGATCLALLAIALLLRATVLRPLRQLTLATQRLTGGLLDIDVGYRDRQDEIGTLARALDTFRMNVLDKVISERKVSHLARHDALTDLPNRSSFNEHLDRALEQHGKSGHRVAVIAIDIDQLKEINEAHGHAAGDEMLKNISRLMTAELGEGEFVARVGGDEFAAIKTFSDQDALLRFVARIEASLSAELSVMDTKLRAGGYLGVAVFPTDANTKDELVNRADMALHRAMEEAGLPVCFYEARIEEAARNRRRLAEDMKHAIERKELTLVYQAQVSVKTSALTGYEALLRWNHPERGPIPPSEFIPLAEESGLIADIGDWVLRTACQEACSWPGGIKVAVNLSPLQLSDSDLAERIHDILLETGLPPQNLEVEITESAIIGDTAKALAIVTQLKKMQVAIALDDFGVGYSSMDTLKTFPFDKIKLDRSFVAEVGESPQAVAIVRAIIALGHALDIQVLAEGIETELQFELLKAEQCDEAQGYMLGRPKSAEELRPEPALQVG